MLFKVCLLSLAISDLVFVAASGTNYLSKLSRENCLLWVRAFCEEKKLINA